MALLTALPAWSLTPTPSQVKAALDVLAQKITTFTDVGNSLAHVEHLLKDLASFEEKSSVRRDVGSRGGTAWGRCAQCHRACRSPPPCPEPHGQGEGRLPGPLSPTDPRPTLTDPRPTLSDPRPTPLTPVPPSLTPSHPR